jgi:hypothetical protein
MSIGQNREELYLLLYHLPDLGGRCMLLNTRWRQ